MGRKIPDRNEMTRLMLEVKIDIVHTQHKHLDRRAKECSSVYDFQKRRGGIAAGYIPALAPAMDVIW